jgi:hypothetical protein
MTARRRSRTRGARRFALPALAVAVLSLAIAAGTLALSGSAFAFYSTSGSGTLTAGVAQLTAPTISTANAAPGGTVALTWAAAGAPGAVSYSVIRNGGAPGGNCPTVAEPAAEVTTCTDSGLEPGTYTYKVTARYRSWSVTGATKAATVTIGPANRFVLAVASTTLAAAASDNLTITAKDAAGSTVTTYAGAKNLTFEGAAPSPSPSLTKPTVVNSSGTAVAFGTATAITFTNGVATVSSTKNGVMKIYKSGPATISVSDGTIESEVDPTVTVSPLAMSKLVLSAATLTPVAGAEDALTTIAQDAYSNVATAYSGSHSLKYSGPVAALDGTLPTVTDSNGAEVPIGTATPTVFTEGVASASEGKNGALRLYKAAAASTKVTEGTISSAAITITAAPATAAALTLTPTTKTPVAGATDAIKTTAFDAYGNTATGYTGSHTITFTGPFEASPSGTVAAIYDGNGTAVTFASPVSIPLTFTAGVAQGSGTKNGVLKPARSGVATLTASDGTIATEAPVEFIVAAGTAARFAWASPTISAGTLPTPCLFTCAVTGIGNNGTFTAKVAVTDSLGNVVSTLGTGHSVTVTATAGSTVTGGTLTIAATGPAESETTFTYKSKASGTFTDTITAAKSLGTAYTSATATTR